MPATAAETADQPNHVQDISDFDGDGVVYRFKADFRAGRPEMRIEMDCGSVCTTVCLGAEDLGNFAAHIEAARKALLGLWIEYGQSSLAKQEA